MNLKDVRMVSVGKIEDEVFKLNRNGFTVCKADLHGDFYIVTSQKVNVIYSKCLKSDIFSSKKFRRIKWISKSLK